MLETYLAHALETTAGIDSFGGEEMKGGISLKDFIQGVRKELEEARVAPEDAFFELDQITLEASFSLDVSGKGGAKFVVLDVSGESKASQTHKVTLVLKPFTKASGIGMLTLGSRNAGQKTPGELFKSPGVVSVDKNGLICFTPAPSSDQEGGVFGGGEGGTDPTR